MMKRITLLLCCSTALQASISTEWVYSRAVRALQNGQPKNAQQELSSLLIDNPDRADLLYDAGVAAHQLQEYEKANAYFSDAAEKASDEQLKKQALFNSGNSKVALKDLQGALDAYEQALKIDPNDETVKHNRDVVKQMLEQQQQQEQQQNQQEQDRQDQNEQDSQEQEDGNNSNLKKNEQSDANDESSDQSNNSLDGEQEKEQGADQEQRGQHNDQVGNESNRDQSNQQKDNFSDGHASSSPDTKKSNQQKTDSQPNKPDGKEQAMQDVMEDSGDYREQERKEIEKGLPEHQKWMARALEKLEELEEQEQKRLIKVQMQKQADYDEQNSW